MSFLKSSRRKTEEIRIERIRFLGEQDGPPEQLLKARLTDFLRGHGCVGRAYLVRADFGDGSGVSVVLGLRMQTGPEKGMVESVSCIFADVFDAKEYLDILFLSASQETQISHVCRAFFNSD